MKLPNIDEKINIKKGTLYLVGTPIGNLKDISLRAAQILEGVDYVAAEDTRNSGILLKALDIKSKFISYHEHNISSKTGYLISLLVKGSSIALISDAGMPCISDPGYEIVRECNAYDIEVIVIPGPCAAITALVGSGFDASSFSFMGFLPVKGQDRTAAINDIFVKDTITVLYEAPHRVLKTLDDFSKIGMGDRKICIAREMTKKFEQFLRVTVTQGILYFKENTPKGEFVIVIDRYEESEKAITEDKSENDIQFPRLKNIITDLLNQKIPIKEITELLWNEFGVARNKVYKLAMEIKKNNNNA